MALSAYFAVRGKKKRESFIHSFIHSDKSRFNTECVFSIERVAKQKRWHLGRLGGGLLCEDPQGTCVSRGGMSGWSLERARLGQA